MEKNGGRTQTLAQAFAAAYIAVGKELNEQWLTPMHKAQPGYTSLW